MKMQPLPDRPDETPWVADPYETLVVPLRKGWRWLAGAALAGAVVGLILGVNKPNAFESNAKLLVRTGAREEGTPETRLALTEQTGTIAPREAVANELQVLSDPALYEAVARRVTPQRILAPCDPAEEDGASVPLPVRGLHRVQSAWFGLCASLASDHEVDDCDRCVEAATETLSKKFGIKSEPGSSVITLTYSAHSPTLARDVVDGFVQVAVEHHQTVFATDSSLEFLNRQVSEAMKDATRAESVLAENRIQCGIFDEEATRKGLLEEMAKLEARLHEDAARMDELRSLSGMLAGSLEKEPETRTRLVERAPITNPTYTWLKQRVHELETQQLEPSGRLDMKSAIDQQIGDLQARLAEQPEFLEPGASMQPVVNARFDRLKGREDEVREELTALESGTQKRVARLGELRQELERVEQCGPLLRDLQANAEQSRTHADQLGAARDRLSVINMLDHVNMSNLRLLQGASRPMAKVGPKRGRLIAIGALLGCVAGVMTLFLRRSLDRRVREPRDLFALAGERVVCVVPDVGTKPVPALRVAP